MGYGLYRLLGIRPPFPGLEMLGFPRRPGAGDGDRSLGGGDPAKGLGVHDLDAASAQRDQAVALKALQDAADDFAGTVQIVGQGLVRGLDDGTLGAEDRCKSLADAQP
jgi:hypothetical protein